jgi:basic amino acid/polyamine antiporter, APA family
MAVAAERRGGLLRDLFATRSTEVLLAETSEDHHTLRRNVGALDLAALGVGAIIGSGIFVVVGTGANLAGPAVIISFALAALTCLFAALSYSELAASIPVSGSAYTYAYATMGESVAWILGWNLILEYGVAVAAVLIAWSGNLNSFLDTTFGFTIPDAISASPEGGGVINLVSVAMVALCIYLMTRLPGTTWWRFGVWPVVGVAIYAAYGYRNSRLRRGTPPRGGVPTPAPAPGPAGS